MTSTAVPRPTPTADLPPLANVRVLGAAMVVVLLGQLLLGMANAFWLALPESGRGWDDASPSWLLSAHMALGTAVLVLAVWIGVLAARRRARGWLVASAAGIAGIVVAFAGGTGFMGDVSNDTASFVMAFGAALAIGAYALALYPAPARG
jgi:hypothetical protein